MFKAGLKFRISRRERSTRKQFWHLTAFVYEALYFCAGGNYCAFNDWTRKRSEKGKGKKEKKNRIGNKLWLKLRNEISKLKTWMKRLIRIQTLDRNWTIYKWRNSVSRRTFSLSFIEKHIICMCNYITWSNSITRIATEF